jgi:hypothetical protein
MIKCEYVIDDGNTAKRNKKNWGDRLDVGPPHVRLLGDGNKLPILGLIAVYSTDLREDEYLTLRSF